MKSCSCWIIVFFSSRKLLHAKISMLQVQNLVLWGKDISLFPERFRIIVVVILWKNVFLNPTKYNKTNDWLVKCCNSRRISSFLLRTVFLKNSKLDYQKILRLKIVLGWDQRFCQYKSNITTWDKLFKNGPSKVCLRQPLNDLKWYGLLGQTILLQIF